MDLGEMKMEEIHQSEHQSEGIHPGDIVEVFAGKKHIGLGIVIERHEIIGGRGYRYKLVLISTTRRIRLKKTTRREDSGGGCLDGTELL